MWLSLLVVGSTGAQAQDDTVHWGALHEHSGLSRAAYGFTADDAFAHMRDQAGLSFGAVTDYDWAHGIEGTWDDARRAVNAAHCPEGEPGCDAPFVALLAYEWNNNSGPTDDDPDAPEYGHRNVYLVDTTDPEAPYVLGDCEAQDGCAPLVTSGEGRVEGREDWATWKTPCDLWAALDGLTDHGFAALTVPHHVALSVSGAEGDALWGRTRPAATDWSWHPQDCEGVRDPDALEPLVELYSTWGNHEHAHMTALEDPVDGLADAERVVREVALGGAAGPVHQLGFLGSGDNHAGNAGEDPRHSFLEQPDGAFRSYLVDCAPDAPCTVRFGRTGLVGVRLDGPLTREAVFEALADRHTVATTGEPFDVQVDVVADGVRLGRQGDAVDTPPGAVLAVRLDLGDATAAEVAWVVGQAGTWTEHPLADAVGHAQWSGETAVADLVPGDATVYLRVAATPVGALEVPDGAAPLGVLGPDGARQTVSLPAGRTTAEALIAAWDLATVDHDPALTLTHDAEGLFAIQGHDRATGDPVPVTLQTASAPELAYVLGLRDDADTLDCSPCVGAIAVDGGELVERAWASPVWLSLQGPGDSDAPGDTGEDADDGTCSGCSTAPPSPALWPWLALLWVGRRRC